jgi:hypothetical protein
MSLFTLRTSVTNKPVKLRHKGRIAYTPSGIKLEKRLMYMTPRGWKAAERLSEAKGVGKSQLVESMVLHADYKQRKHRAWLHSQAKAQFLSKKGAV